MRSKKDSRAKRRKQLLNAAPDAPQSPLFQLTQPPSGNSVDNPHPWDGLARSALTLGDDFMSVALRTAFNKFGLDPVDPFSWSRLLLSFAYIDFGERPRGKPGAPQKWNKKRMDELRGAISEQEQAAGHPLPNTELARRFAPNPRFATKGTKAEAGREGLRKVIGKVRRDMP